MKRTYYAQLHKEGDAYWAKIPDLGYCLSQDKTVESTMDGLADAAQAMVEAMIEKGKPLPEATTVENMDRVGVLAIMPVQVVEPQKTVRFNISAPGHYLEEIDQAAKRRKMSRSQFMITSSLNASR